MNTSIAEFISAAPTNSDGDAEWTSGTDQEVRTYSGYRAKGPPFWTYATDVRLADNVGAFEITAEARIGTTLGIDLALGPQTEIWATRIEKTVAPADPPDGLEAQKSYFQEDIQWITRVPIPATSVVFDEHQLYNIRDVEPVNRGRFYLVSASRRYRALSV